jgi:hypothetical protein
MDTKIGSIALIKLSISEFSEVQKAVKTEQNSTL